MDSFADAQVHSYYSIRTGLMQSGYYLTGGCLTAYRTLNCETMPELLYRRLCCELLPIPVVVELFMMG